MAVRPDFNQAVKSLLLHITKTLPEFAHVKPSRIVVVAGEARRASHATVKPLAFAGRKRVDSLGRRKPLVKIEGKRVLYCITLRPLFFLRSSPRERVATLLHELFHISKNFDGTLDSQRRHAEMGHRFENSLRPLERRLWSTLPPNVLGPFTYDGEVRIRQWLEKPGSYFPAERLSARRLYSEEHLFDGIVRLRTRATH